MTPKIGSRAPSFSLPDQDGVIRRLSDAKGKWLLLYFYPKDMTPGCTVEACAIRDAWSDFAKQGIIVYGVSTDAVVSHKKFSGKYKLPFPLLADTEKVLVNTYGVWGKKKFMGREYLGTKRMSFLINPQGRITKIYDTVKPPTHAAEVLRDIASLSKQ